MPTTTADILSVNLAQLARTEPELVQRLRGTEPAAVTWNPLANELWSATIDGGEVNGHRPVALASRYDPLAEARKITSIVDHQKHAAIVVLGLGLGYHVAEVARQIGDNSVLIVFEPDVRLLRAVLEKMDHSGWLGRPNIIVADPTLDLAGLLRRLERFSAQLTLGTVLVSHAPTRQLHGPDVQQFGQMVTDVLAFCRTNVATALVNASRTVRNLCLNLPWYAAGANTNALHNAAQGYPAVCVAAGPSLAKNVDQLRDPAVRRNVVVIAAQTTLKPLLDRGIKPDFVTALDYHEISRRFYDGLPQLPTVTLVAQSMANPAIVDNFPGPVRMTRSHFLTRLLGNLAPEVTPIRDGATVAHLSFYLAQHLGCDPIIFIGQDLGFSDGLYYCPGTAIHDVWAPELNVHNTLEMMEWQRIVRHRNHLSKATDIHGRSIYSDEQMNTYLKQFERDFAAAPQKLLDASEGGVAKARAQVTTLQEALAAHATRPVPPLPLPPRELDAKRLAAAAALMGRRIDEVRELDQLSNAALPILRQMLEHQCDEERMEKLFARLDKIKHRVGQLDEMFNLVNEINTLGAFRRARTDRAIHHGSDDESDRQQRRIERDLDNIEWLAQACVEVQQIFREAQQRLRASVKKKKI